MRIFLTALVLLAIFVLIAVRFFRGRIPVEPTVAPGEPPAPGVTNAGASVDPNAIKMADIVALAITLDVDERPSLFIPGAPLLALFEKWAAGTTGIVRRRQGRNRGCARSS